MENTVKLHFGASGYEFERDLFPSILNVEPTRFRTRDDWPDAVKKNKNIQLKTSFTYDIVKPNLEYTDELFDEMTNVFNNHVDELLKVKNQYNLDYGFCLVVHTNRDSFPRIFLHNNFISLLSQLEAEIDFDIYFDVDEVPGWDDMLHQD